jgi:hypothetical protein
MGSVGGRRGSGRSLGTSRESFTCIKELTDSGIRLDDTSRLCLLLAMMARQGNRYDNLHKIY